MMRQISEHQFELAEKMEAALTPRPKGEEIGPFTVIHAYGNWNEKILIIRNGHEIGWISGFELAQAVDSLKDRSWWLDGERNRFAGQRKDENAS